MNELRLPKKLKERLQNSFWIFILTFLFQIIISIFFLYKSYSILPEGINTIDGAGYISNLLKSSMKALFWSTLFWWVISIVSNNIIRKIIEYIIVISSTFIFLFELVTVYYYGALYSGALIQIILATNPQEAKEYIESAFSLTYIFYIVLSLGLLYAIVKVISKIINRYINSIYIEILSIIMIIPIIMMISYTIPEIYKKIKGWNDAYAYSSSPYDRLVWNSILYINSNKAMNENLDKIKDLSLDFNNTNKFSEKINLVIVIGETLRRDYMHLYGFSLDNTPKLDSISSTGDMISFSNVVSPAPTTLESLTKVFSYKIRENSGEWYNYPPITKVFRDAGYWVDWISNQNCTSEFLQPLTAFMNLSNDCKYTFAIDKGYDENIFRFLDNTNEFKDNTKGNVRFIHLIGSHQAYKSRYPIYFEKFSFNDILIYNNDKEKSEIISNYVNSIYYNDFILSKIMNSYSDGNNIVIYFSDHGEVLFDDPSNKNYANHGLTEGGVSIPLLFYISPELRKKHPELYDTINKAKDKKIMLDIFTHTIPSILGIETQYSDSKYNFLSDDYDENRTRVIEGFNKVLEI